MSTTRSTGRDTAPLPPLRIARRSGSPPGPDDDPYGDYLATGADCRREIEELLAPDWSWEGKRVLDFGCGAGRTLRHFLAEAELAELHGCDIYREGVEWLGRNLSPPLAVHHVGKDPPLPFEDGHFDLIWALSVFTHLTDNWSGWLLELRRVLAPDGLLIATFVGQRLEREYRSPRAVEPEIGMNVLAHAAPWEQGGPLVLHSDWWLRAHWGRAFEVLEVDSSPRFEHAAPQRWWLLRRREGELSVAELERLEPGEERERLALGHNRLQLQDELERIAAGRNEAAVRRRALREAAVRYESTLSWRLTRPLRTIGSRLGRRRRR